eukprot:jgi/Psemu1/45444/gm1.45444_g
MASTPQSLLEQLLNLFEVQAVGALASFGYLDDTEGEAGELVLVDSDMLSQTTTAAASRVLLRTLDHHLAELLEAHPGRLSIPVMTEGIIFLLNLVH